MINVCCHRWNCVLMSIHYLNFFFFFTRHRIEQFPNNGQELITRFSMHSRHGWVHKRCSVLLRTLGTASSWKGSQSLQEFQACGLCVSGAKVISGRRPGHLLWPRACASTSSNRGFFLTLGSGERRQRADRYAIYSGGQGPAAHLIHP